MAMFPDIVSLGGNPSRLHPPVQVFDFYQERGYVLRPVEIHRELMKAAQSSSERSIQAVFSCTVMRWVSRSAVTSSRPCSAAGKMERAVLATAS